MAYSNVATALFSVRNADKTTSGDIGRLPVTVGQGGAAIKAVSQLDNPISRALSKGLNIAKSDKVVSKLGKVVKFASDNVNPLIVASSGLKVVLAEKEERRNTIISEAGCLAGMFLGEGLMKKHLDKVLTKLPIDKKFIPIIRGVIFVAGSIGSSTIGQKIGKKVAHYWDKPLVNEKKQEQKVYEPLNLKG